MPGTLFALFKLAYHLHGRVCIPIQLLLALGLQKPSQKSKAKGHQECLVKRPALWKDGKIEELLREGRTIQKRLVKYHQKKDPLHKAKIFPKFIMDGQINSALRYLTDDGCGGVLSLTNDVMKQLQNKHPKAQPAKLGSLLFGPVEEEHESDYNKITGEMIREAALRTKGAGGPSNVDANGFQRILASKSFKKSGSNLCDVLATLTRRLCTTIEPILASRLTPLDKDNSEVRPMGMGEVIRRIIGKRVIKQDIIESSGSLQVCAGHKSGSEAAVHAIHSLFQHEETDAVLFVDTSNAFNSLSLSQLIVQLATFAINTARRYQLEQPLLLLLLLLLLLSLLLLLLLSLLLLLLETVFKFS